MLAQRPSSANGSTARLFGQFFATHERVLWHVSDFAWDELGPDSADEPTLDAVRGAMLVESHNPVYSATLLKRFRNAPRMTDFLALWTYEEFKHFAALKAYLEAAEGRSPNSLTPELIETRKQDWIIPTYYTDLMIASYTMVQELVTGIFYKTFARRVQEPILRSVLMHIGKDEYRHCQFYFDYAKELLDADRSRLEEVEVALQEFEMPGPTFVPDYENRHGAAMLAAAGPGMSAFREVTSKVTRLVGKGHNLRIGVNPLSRQRLQQLTETDA